MGYVTIIVKQFYFSILIVLLAYYLAKLYNELCEIKQEFKILLREKRKAVEVVYELALQRLLALEKEECLALYTALLEKYAEEGDEIVLSDKFTYIAELSALPVVSKRNLKISDVKSKISGGMKLIGKLADKDLSFTALLTADKDENQAELARKLFQ